MANEGKVALLKGKRGIAIDPAKASVPDYIRNEAGLQGISLNEVALLSKIPQWKFYGILAGRYEIRETELQGIEEALCIKIDRQRLIPSRWKLTEESVRN